LITKKNRRIFFITFGMILIIVLVTVWTLVKSYRPTPGKPYERLSVEEARNFMTYEDEYVVVDAREKQEYEKGHLEKAVNLPYDSIVSEADEVIGDRRTMVYVYGSTGDQSCAAAQKLADMGYQSITEIGAYSDWMLKETETENLLAVPLG